MRTDECGQSRGGAGIGLESLKEGGNDPVFVICSAWRPAGIRRVRRE